MIAYFSELTALVFTYNITFRGSSKGNVAIQPVFWKTLSVSRCFRSSELILSEKPILSTTVDFSAHMHKSKMQPLLQAQCYCNPFTIISHMPYEAPPLYFLTVYWHYWHKHLFELLSRLVGSNGNQLFSHWDVRVKFWVVALAINT